MKFQEAVMRACEDNTSELSETTRQDIRSLLRDYGRIGSVFGDVELDVITAESIREWVKLNKDLKINTIDKYLYAFAFVFRWAIENRIVNLNPVGQYRVMFRKRNSKSMREGKDPSRNIRPLRPSACKALVDASFEHGTDSSTSMLLLMMDAGLRAGEAFALRWEHVGDDCLDIVENLPRHIREPVAPKSGYRRRVQMSQRLRDHLISLRGLDEERVSNPMNYDSFRMNGWKLILEKSGLEKVRFKDLRDTYACTLLSCGIPIAYIAKQLGHTNVMVTARHYAQWLHDGWKPPVQLLEGQVPADLLAVASNGI